MKINVLPQSIANMIAAGEVVERPASVVKELVENSLDAGARAVTIEIKHGGMSYIRITDDGCAIAPDEVITAFKRHATSKIQTEEDLNSIYTLGFRGEALASVAAVARVDIFTKTRDNQMGYTAELEAGDVISYGEAGCPDGTTITVRDLFFNTPARMKFLKSDSTETSYVTDIVNKFVLSHPEIKFKLIVNGKTTISSPGDGKLISSVRTVFGKDYVAHLNEIDYVDEGVRVSGLIGTNALARKDRRQQVFFLNGRYIKSKIISAAISEAYQNVMMVGKYPVAILNISVSGSFVDVNVHPTKMEVRFSDDKKMYSSIYWAVKNGLSEKKYVPKIEIKKNDEISLIREIQEKKAKSRNEAIQSDINLLRDTYLKNHQAVEPAPEDRPQNKTIDIKTAETGLNADKGYEDKKVSIEHPSPAPYKETEAFVASDSVNTDDSIPKGDKLSNELIEQNVCENSFFAPEDIFPDMKSTAVLKEDSRAMEIFEVKTVNTEIFDDFMVIGQVFSTYIIAQRQNEMLIIDQHAAHERIYFEELLEGYRAKEIKKQMLLMPETLSLDPVNFELAMNNLELLDSLGFECEHFGDNSLIVRTVPGFMPDSDIADTVYSIIELLDKGTVDIKKTLMEDILHTMACKRAIKGNTDLTKAEMEALTRKVLSFDSINTCPHGRPIVTAMSKYELEKSFKRIV